MGYRHINNNDCSRNQAVRSVAVLVAVLVLCTACAGPNRATMMRLTRTEGNVSVRDDTDTEMDVTESMGLYSGYRMKTEWAGYAWINLDNRKLAKMDQETGIEIRKTGKDLEILLQSGSVYFNVTEPLKEDETMQIRTSNMAVGIRGTCGWVETYDSQSARVCILEGTVECSVTAAGTGEGKTESVSAGQTAFMRVKDGSAEIIVEAFGPQNIPDFVRGELEADALQELLEYWGIEGSEENSWGGFQELPRDYAESGSSAMPADESENGSVGGTAGEGGSAGGYTDIPDGDSLEDLLDSSKNPFLEMESIDLPPEVAWADAGMEDHPMVWGDENLEQAMRRKTRIMDGDIMLSDVWEMTALDLSVMEIRNISALGELTNLKALDISFNEITDISPLGNLKNLMLLSLGNAGMSDIGPLRELTELSYLSLSGSPVSDISPLAGLTNLRRVELVADSIRDISPLENLTGLTDLNMGGNGIQDISSLAGLTNLKNLTLDGNSISDVSPLAGLSKLESLRLGGNQVSDISALSGLVNLKELHLSGNPISDFSPVNHLGEGVIYR